MEIITKAFNLFIQFFSDNYPNHLLLCVLLVIGILIEDDEHSVADKVRVFYVYIVIFLYFFVWLEIFVFMVILGALFVSSW